MFEFLKRNFEFVKKILETPWESPKRALKYFYFPRKRGEVYREYPKIVLFSKGSGMLPKSFPRNSKNFHEVKK